jgi:hypothetical protein
METKAISDNRIFRKVSIHFITLKLSSQEYCARTLYHIWLGLKILTNEG